MDSMSLESTLDDIVTKLRAGRYPNEAAISTGIVLRVLRTLNWEDHDAEVVWPEYNVGKGRVDFALCHPPSKPIVFVEVKQPGAAESEDSIEQALLYGFRQGVPVVVLTDGRTWSFYLPAEPGSYEERRVLRLDLYESSSRDAEAALENYLEHGRVASCEALKAARREYRNRTSRDTARRALPVAWSKLVREGNELVVRLLADAVESQTKVRPIDADVLEFLRSLPIRADSGRLPHPNRGVIPVDAPSVSPEHDAHKRENKPRKRYQGAVIVAGKRLEYKSLIEAMITVLTELENSDYGFLNEFSKLPGIKRRKRTIIAKTAAEIFPRLPHLRKMVGQLPNGWLVCTNFSPSEVMKVIEKAEDASGTPVMWDPPIEARQSNAQFEQGQSIASTGSKKQSTTGHRTIKRTGTVIIDGKRHGYASRAEAIEIVLTELQNANYRFLNELAEHPKIRGRRRALVARSAEEMFSDSPHLRHKVGRLPHGWLFCKDTLDSQVAMKIVDTAVEVSGANLVWDPPVTSN